MGFSGSAIATASWAGAMEAIAKIAICMKFTYSSFSGCGRPELPRLGQPYEGCEILHLPAAMQTYQVRAFRSSSFMDIFDSLIL